MGYELFADLDSTIEEEREDSFGQSAGRDGVADGVARQLTGAGMAGVIRMRRSRRIWSVSL